MKITTTKTVVTKGRAELSRELFAACRRLAKVPRAAQHVRISFHVPSGADWSGVDLDIDGDNPIVVEWSLTKESSK